MTAPTLEGLNTNTATVVGDMTESTLANNTANASVTLVREGKPPVFCTAIVVRPKQLYVGRATKMHITVTNHHKVVKGVRVRITGPGINLLTKPSNKHGNITRLITPRKSGIVVFRPLATKSCKTPRVGITGIFTPPVTG